jgi:transcriptional regulator with XRE-family HTH domain
MSQNDWPGRLTQVVAAQVRRYRLARKMSAQALADRCAELGMEIPRPVLANLENGRRPIVSVAELLILAAALDVAPVVLVAPLGHESNVEILPGRELDTWDAALWISGETRLSADAADSETEWLDLVDDRSVVPLYHQHDRLLKELEQIDEGHVTLEDEEGNVIDQRPSAIANLRGHRALMGQRGLLLPPLPAGLEDIDSKPRRGTGHSPRR